MNDKIKTQIQIMRELYSQADADELLRDCIADAGGQSALARLLDVKPPRVSQWARRGLPLHWVERLKIVQGAFSETYKKEIVGRIQREQDDVSQYEKFREIQEYFAEHPPKTGHVMRVDNNFIRKVLRFLGLAA